MTHEAPTRPDMAETHDWSDGSFKYPVQRSDDRWPLVVPIVMLAAVFFCVLVVLGFAAFAEASITEYNRAVICAERGC